MTDNRQHTAERIAALNDAFRITLAGRGTQHMTKGILTLPMEDQIDILCAVIDFTDFASDNDPHGEHDFGAFDHAGRKIFWKIDTYADERMEHGAEDCTGPTAFRVLTVMLASEY